MRSKIGRTTEFYRLAKGAKKKKHKTSAKIMAIFMAFIITVVALPTQAIALYIEDDAIIEDPIAIQNDSDAVTGVEFEGVWYNRESYFYYNGEYTYPRITRSISVIIDNVGLESINSYISSTYNTYALVGDNCVDFAIHIWNIASPVNITTQDVALIASLPKNLTTYIADHFDNHESNVVLSAPTIYRYYDGATFVDLLG